MKGCGIYWLPMPEKQLHGQVSVNRTHAKHYTHAKQANEPRPGKDLRIYIEKNGKRGTGGVDKDVWGLFTRLRKGKFGHGPRLETDVVMRTRPTERSRRQHLLGRFYLFSIVIY